jgi:hypothetical protein
MNDRKELKRSSNISQQSSAISERPGLSVRKMDFLPWSKNECDFEADPAVIPRYPMSDRVNSWLENIDSIDYNLVPECLFRVKTAKIKND